MTDAQPRASVSRCQRRNEAAALRFVDSNPVSSNKRLVLLACSQGWSAHHPFVQNVSFTHQPIGGHLPHAMRLPILKLHLQLLPASNQVFALPDLPADKLASKTKLMAVPARPLAHEKQDDELPMTGRTDQQVTVRVRTKRGMNQVEQDRPRMRVEVFRKEIVHHNHAICVADFD
jgi:hypothetical protein